MRLIAREVQNQRQNTLSPDDLIMERRLYEREREDRKIYRDQDLHMTIIQLIFSLMLAPKCVLNFPLPLARALQAS
jgi:hypothetical protein